MDEKDIGLIDHYFSNISVAMIRLSDSLKVGDRIHVKGKTADFSQDVSSMQIDRVPAEEAKAGDLVSLKVSEKAHKNDKVYKIDG